MTENEVHPWKAYIPPNSKTLIVGTFPPTKRNWSYDFFYPNKQNLFWTVISAINKSALEYFSGEEAVNERIGILENLKLGVTDMGLEINRLNGNSLDENLSPIEYMDILKILNEHPTINKLIFTSSSGPASAARWFVNYLKTRNILHRFASGPKPLRSILQLEHRSVELVVLYSPSRRAANRISLEKLIEMYEHEIRGTV
ncbi:MAG: hypothetical protein EOO02_05095 [Chitinophagaceae bacterium]|nr:MAG: hypothetical protein EOO02_05095 [Chitinophagaceae bacterium]